MKYLVLIAVLLGNCAAPMNVQIMNAYGKAQVAPNRVQISARSDTTQAKVDSSHTKR